jgi:hypothetical protein
MAEKEQIKVQPLAAPPPQFADVDLGHEIAPLPVEPGDQDYEDEDENAPESIKREVFYLHLANDKFERAAAVQWLKALNEKHRKEGKPEVPTQNLCDEIPLSALRSHSRIIILARKGTSRDPIRDAQPVIERNDQGHLIHKDVPSAELAKDMHAYGNIRLKDFWQNGRKRFAADIHFSALVSEIAKYASPYVTKWRDSADERTSSPERLLYLGWC